MTERRRGWTAHIPDRWAFLRLLVAPSSYLLVVALIATAIAKLAVIHGLEDIGFWPGRWLAATAADVATFLGVAAVLAAAEIWSRWALIVTLPVSLIVTALGLVNVGYLSITGDQLSAQVLVLGFQRIHDVGDMAGASLHPGALAVVCVVLIVAIPPVLAAIALRRAGRPLSPTADGGPRARALGLCAAMALVVALAVPLPRSVNRFSPNAVARTCWELVTGGGSWHGGLGLFAGYQPRELVTESTVAALRTGARPNIVLVILESTRRDVTSLAGPTSSASTPNLAALAARGLELTHARAVIPHTTKSVWSMLCGRLPILQPMIFETSPSIDVQCLPHILDAAGWRTAFLQSAFGEFEDRPRLVHALGYRELVTGEELAPEEIGYLATDDEVLVSRFAAFVDRAPAQPFFATILTSATHHPYALTPAVSARVATSGAPHETDRERYDRQVEASDQMLGGILETLRVRGLADHTIVVVLGDHGEGFGDKGVRQHASNFYEEGLRVPWVIAGPGVAARRLDGDESLIDLAPTLLDLLGAEMSPEAAAATYARSVLRVDPKHRALPFSCFFDSSCNGFVQDGTKVVVVPETGEELAFDLAADPDERNPASLSPALAATLAEVERTIDLHRTRGWPRQRGEVSEFPLWTCPADVRCHLHRTGR